MRRSAIALLTWGLMLLSYAAVAAEPEAATATCGNGVLEAGETCDACATDCTVRPCLPAPATVVAPITVVLPSDQKVSSVTLRVAYRSDALSLPGKGADESIRARVSGLPTDSLSAVNDVGYALRVVVSRPDRIASGPLLTVTFDRCQGAAEAVIGNLACVVEQCGSQAGLISGCTCSIRMATP